MHGRLSLLAAGAVLAVAASPAHAAPNATLGAAVTLISQPANAPWSIGLGTSVAFANPDGTQPSPVRTMQFRFPPGKANWTKFPACDQARLEERKDPDGCPAGSRIGKG